MKKYLIFFLLSTAIVAISCNKKETADEILHKTVNTIDTIESVYYKQDMARTNPQHIQDTIYRYREIYLQRLKTDSVVGAKGHWYMYINDKEHVIYEDIYDGNKLIRKNNKDSAALLYDLKKYPEFKERHFWGHNTLYGMQYELKFMFANSDFYSLERINDTIIDGRNCYRVSVRLENKMTMPGFASKLEDNEGSISNTIFMIDKETYYPIRIKGENYSGDNPEEKVFIEQRYYDIRFNLSIDEEVQFNTSCDSTEGYDIKEILPE